MTAGYVEHYAGERRQDWTTPRSLFDPLQAEFEFTADGASDAATALLPRFYTAADVLVSWAGERVFCNPPCGDTGSPSSSSWLRSPIWPCCSFRLAVMRAGSIGRSSTAPRFDSSPAGPSSRRRSRPATRRLVAGRLLAPRVSGRTVSATATAYVVAFDSAIAGAVVLLGVALSRTRERLSRLEGVHAAANRPESPQASSQEPI